MTPLDALEQCRAVAWDRALEIERLRALAPARLERCPGTGTHYLPIYSHLPNGQEIKTLKYCSACSHMTLIDARRPWMPFHKRAMSLVHGQD